jgi:hypothetical protein
METVFEKEFQQRLQEKLDDGISSTSSRNSIIQKYLSQPLPEEVQ